MERKTQVLVLASRKAPPSWSRARPDTWERASDGKGHSRRGRHASDSGRAREQGGAGLICARGPTDGWQPRAAATSALGGTQGAWPFACGCLAPAAPPPPRRRASLSFRLCVARARLLCSYPQTPPVPGSDYSPNKNTRADRTRAALGSSARTCLCSLCGCIRMSAIRACVSAQCMRRGSWEQIVGCRGNTQAPTATARQCHWSGTPICGSRYIQHLLLLPVPGRTPRRTASTPLYKQPPPAS